MTAEMQRPDRKKQPLQRALIAGAGLLLVACTSTQRGNGSLPTTAHTPDFPAATAPTQSSSPSPRPSASLPPIDEALRNFGIAINEKQVARIVMDTCVAWQNTSGGLTITYNPGYAHVTGTSKQAGDILVFGSGVLVAGYPKPSLSVSDGPGVFTDGKTTVNEIKTHALTLFMGNSSPLSIDGSASVRHVTTDLVIDDGEQTAFYRDTASHEPVIETKLVDGSLDFVTITPICEELRQN